VRRKVGALSAGLLVLALAATGCTKTTDSGGPGTEAQKQQGAVSYDAADNTGPAKAVDGASSGGIITILQSAEFDHLDPQKSYVTNQQMLGLELYRALTAWKETGSGPMKLVGDLAVDPGTDVNKDCKTWQYKLRPGLKYEDGSAIKAADVAYGVARSFDADFGDGPTYIQSWLAGSAEYNATFKGPYAATGGGDIPPGVKVVDDSTITFTFPVAHCDFPFAASLPTTVPVPKAKDTKAAYDLIPFSSGPYKSRSTSRARPWCSSATRTGTPSRTRSATPTRTATRSSSARTRPRSRSASWPTAPRTRPH
jgi:peptide/nickel transport system substrate-binding protein